MEKEKVALYGLGTETERYISTHGEAMSIVGLLDGFRTSGELYGYPIFSLEEAIAQGIAQIIVVARPGSCKVIAKRIGEQCRESGIALFDVRGNDLLLERKVSYDLNHVQRETKALLLDKIARAEVVSFDLFDTLIMRKFMEYTDVFAAVDVKLQEQGIIIKDFAKVRLAAEKELSRMGAPTLEEIYEEILKQSQGCPFSAEQLAELEWQTDTMSFVAREEMCVLFRQAVAAGKQVVVTTDSYYCEKRIKEILNRFGLSGAQKVFISCECGSSKTLELFEKVRQFAGTRKVLHVGDDEMADVESALRAGFETSRIYSAKALFEELGTFGADGEIISLSDKIKVGLWIARLFANPFCFEDEGNQVSVKGAFDIGYLFCASVILDFVFWMRRRLREEGISQILFCARDGYLVEQIYKKIEKKAKSVYFLTSRKAAVRAGVDGEEDLAYVDSMNYFGTMAESTKARFGIELETTDREWRKRKIVENSSVQKANYRAYVQTLKLDDGLTAVFDFVAKGTVQMYLRKLLKQPLKGFYFLQLEPEFMMEKHLDIESFYKECEKDASAIFDYYYILETILTSPDPSVEEFDTHGVPKYEKETRSEQAIRCVMEIQRGICTYAEEYLSLIPREMWRENKKLGELLLGLLGRLDIREEEFHLLWVEDPFFGRATKVSELLTN